MNFESLRMVFSDMMGVFYRISIFVVIFAPLFAYIHAQSLLDFHSRFKKIPDPFPWEEDHASEHRSCGCGGDLCEKNGNCKTKGFNPICCSNVCRCIDSGVSDITEDKQRQCEICEQTQDWKIFKIGKLCKNATKNEFNCWKTHQTAAVIFKPNFDLVYQYTYT